MAILPFTAAIVPMLHKSPWTETACVYLSRSNLVLHLQRLNLDGPENRDIVQDTLNDIQINALGEILIIATEARDSRRVGNVGRMEEDTVFETTQDVRTCIAQLTENIFQIANNAQWEFGVETADRTRRMVIIALCCEALADFGNIGGFFNRQLYTKRKQVETPEQSKTRKTRGGKDTTHLDSDLEQDAVKPQQKAHQPERKRARIDIPGHESPLFMEQDEEFQAVGQDALDGGRADDLFDKDFKSILDATADKSDEEAETGDLPEVHGAGQIGQAALPTIHAPTSVPWRIRGRAMHTFLDQKDYKALKADFDFMERTCKSLRRTFAKRVAKFRRRELHVCQGDCFHALEEADHRNWEKGQEIDSLKASVAGLQSQVEVLSNVVAERDGDYKEKCEEIIELKARIQELEQQAKKGKTVSFAAGTK